MKFTEKIAHIFLPLERMPRVPLVFLVATLVMMLQLPASLLIHEVSLGVGVAVNEIVVIVGIPFILVWLMHLDAHALFPHTPPRARTWPAILMLALGAVIVMDYLMAGSEAFWPLPEKYEQLLDQVMAVSSAPEFAYKLALLCVLPGICEELFFRGFCQTSFTHVRGPVFGIIAAAVLFALMHGNPWHMHLYLLLGCFLGWTYSVSGTLIVPIACHIFNNVWTLTHHALGTTLPLKDAPIALNALVCGGGVLLMIVGGILFKRLSAVR